LKRARSIILEFGRKKKVKESSTSSSSFSFMFGRLEGGSDPTCSNWKLFEPICCCCWTLKFDFPVLLALSIVVCCYRWNRDALGSKMLIVVSRERRGKVGVRVKAEPVVVWLVMNFVIRVLEVMCWIWKIHLNVLKDSW